MFPTVVMPSDCKGLSVTQKHSVEAIIEYINEILLRDFNIEDNNIVEICPHRGSRIYTHKETQGFCPEYSDKVWAAVMKEFMMRGWQVQEVNRSAEMALQFRARVN
jgi:hypothetical protein